ERQGGSGSLRRLGGLAAASPLLAALYLIPALNLGGIPPLSGFIGKATLLEAGVDAGTPLAWLLVAGAVCTSLLTLYAVMRVWTKAFWRPRDDAPEGDVVAARPTALLDDVGDVALAERTDVGRMPSLMVGSTAGLVVVG